MKQEFKKDFDFSQSNSMRLHTLIFKLKKWIKILDNRSKMMLQWVDDDFLFNNKTWGIIFPCLLGLLSHTKKVCWENGISHYFQLSCSVLLPKNADVSVENPPPSSENLKKKEHNDRTQKTTT